VLPWNGIYPLGDFGVGPKVERPLVALALEFWRVAREVPLGHKLLEVGSPRGVGAGIRGLSVDDGASAEIVSDPSLRWVSYGCTRACARRR